MNAVSGNGKVVLVWLVCVCFLSSALVCVTLLHEGIFTSIARISSQILLKGEKRLSSINGLTEFSNARRCWVEILAMHVNPDTCGNVWVCSYFFKLGS